MEDALVHAMNNFTVTGYVCLNPCFNGRCTRTAAVGLGYLAGNKEVLILVLMEDALVHIRKLWT